LLVDSLPEDGEDIYRTDRWRQVAGDSLDVVEELGTTLYNRDPCNADARQNKHKHPFMEKTRKYHH
jgi:hypothetical protein